MQRKIANSGNRIISRWTTTDDSPAIPKTMTKNGVKQQIAVTIDPVMPAFNRLYFCITDASTIGIVAPE